MPPAGLLLFAKRKQLRFRTWRLEVKTSAAADLLQRKKQNITISHSAAAAFQTSDVPACGEMEKHTVKGTTSLLVKHELESTTEVNVEYIASAWPDRSKPIKNDEQAQAEIKSDSSEALDETVHGRLSRLSKSHKFDSGLEVKVQDGTIVKFRECHFDILASTNNEEIDEAVCAMSRKTLVVAAIWTSVCVMFPAPHAKGACFKICAVISASGALGELASQATVARFMQSGVISIPSKAALLETRRTESRPEAAELAKLYALVAPNFPSDKINVVIAFAASIRFRDTHAKGPPLVGKYQLSGGLSSECARG